MQSYVLYTSRIRKWNSGEYFKMYEGVPSIKRLFKESTINLANFIPIVQHNILLALSSEIGLCTYIYKSYI